MILPTLWERSPTANRRPLWERSPTANVRPIAAKGRSHLIYPLAAAALAALVPFPASAEVAARAPAGFTVVHELQLPATPDRAYRALTDEIGAWWDPAHSYSNDAANFTLDARAGGCFCEQLPNGGSVEHMRVVFAAPGERLRLMGGLGPLQGLGASGPMDFELTPSGDGARLTFRYTVSGFTPDGLGALADPVDGVLAGQLDRLAAYLETGDPVHPAE